jgi:hypothetical protein
MSRFDDELVRQADNAWQGRGLPGSTTPRQLPYDQTTNLYLDGPFGLSSQAPAPEDEMADWVANTPAVRTINVQDLDATMQGEIVGGPGSSAVYAEGAPMYASRDESLDDTLYNVYKASREIRDAIDSQSDFDFTNLFTASTSANEFTRIASDDQDVVYSVGTIAGLVNEIEDNLVVTSNYKQAYEDLQALEGYLEDINKFSSKEDDEEEEEEEEECKHCKGKGCDKCKKTKKSAAYKESMPFQTTYPAGQTHPWPIIQELGHSHTNQNRPSDDSPELRQRRFDLHTKAAAGHRALMQHEAADAHIGAAAIAGDPRSSHQSIQEATERAIDYSQKANGKEGTEAWVSDREIMPRASKEATNGNQETLQITDVRNLEDSGSHFTFEETVTPDHVTNVLVPEEVNGEDAGYVNYYNDGSETGKTPQKDDDRNPFPFDGTNPALAPYAGTVAAVQASRERIFDALQIVERLEKLGMVAEDDRMKHVAKFEQMSDAKLAGFKDSLDMLEDSGARQPRSQKVASGVNRMPEMGRMTTASNVTRQSVQSDDWLMTLK